MNINGEVKYPWGCCSRKIIDLSNWDENSFQLYLFKDYLFKNQHCSLGTHILIHCIPLFMWRRFSYTRLWRIYICTMNIQRLKIICCSIWFGYEFCLNVFVAGWSGLHLWWISLIDFLFMVLNWNKWWKSWCRKGNSTSDQFFYTIFFLNCSLSVVFLYLLD